MRLSAALAVAVAAALVLGCSGCGRDAVIFEGTSMLPGIRDGDRLSLVRFDRGADFLVGRGDVVLFLHEGDPERAYLKRVVGLPGETVELRDGRVLIDGAELPEPYVDPKLNTMREPAPPVRVGPQQYYVLGDNRDNSADSRHWGPVERKHVLGKVTNR